MDRRVHSSSQRQIARNAHALTSAIPSDQTPQTPPPDIAELLALKPPNIPYIPPHLQRDIRAGKAKHPATKHDLRRLLSGIPAAPADTRHETRPRSNSYRVTAFAIA
jgi:hypothetical protein